MSDSQTNVVSITSTKNRSSYEIKLLYDGECPFCVREVNFLRQRDGGRGKVVFVDIADESYSAEENGGIDYQTAMGRIHAILADGTVIQNIEVFRRVYQILGMGWVYALSKIPVVGFIADKIYELWADLRLKITGRPDLASIILEREKRLCRDRGKNCDLTFKG